MPYISFIFFACLFIVFHKESGRKCMIIGYNDTYIKNKIFSTLQKVDVNFKKDYFATLLLIY